MRTLDQLPEIEEVFNLDWFHVMREGAPGEFADVKVHARALRPKGARIEKYLKFEGSITIPNIPTGGGDTFTFELEQAREGDFILVNWTNGIPMGLGIAWVRVAGWKDIEMRIRNYALTDFDSAEVEISALLIRAE